MKLLLITQTETKLLNLQYLIKSSITFASTYEEFLDKLNTNIDTVGFTTKALNQISTSTKFVNLLRAISKLYGYRTVYFAEDTDIVSEYMDNRQNCYVEPALIHQTELTIIEALNKNEIKILTTNDDSCDIEPENLTELLHRFSKNPDNFLTEINNNPKVLKDLMTVAKDVHHRNTVLSRDISRLHSEKSHLLSLTTQISKENNELHENLRLLNDINQINYKNLCAYKSHYDDYQSTIDTVIKHGLPNLKEDLYSSLEVKHGAFPICVLYLKQITHVNYLSSYLLNLLRALIDRRYITKVLRVLPKNSTTALSKYKDYYNTSNGLRGDIFSKLPKFIHLGNPDSILRLMTSNQVPVDVLIVIDETAIDNQYCYGPSVVRFNLANKDTDLKELGLSLDNAIVNEKLTDDSTQVNLLSKFSEYDKICNSKQLVQVYYENLPITQRILTCVDMVRKL